MGRSNKPVVLITGVSGGIGLASARLFMARGWIVVGTVRGRARTAALRGLQVDIQLADMMKPRDLERVVEGAWRTYGRLDALVCNAGYGLVGPIETLSYVQMNEQLTVNTLAPAELVRQVVPFMRRQGGGAIICVSSLLGRTGMAGYSMYAASKFALEGLMESLAVELASGKIRVKLVEPSGVNTGFWAAIKRGSGPRRDDVPIEVYGHGLSPESVAAVIFRATTDRRFKLRYPVGHTRLVGYVRRLLPDRLIIWGLRRIVARH